MTNIVCKSWKVLKVEIKKKLLKLVVQRSPTALTAAPGQLSIPFNKLPDGVGAGQPPGRRHIRNFKEFLLKITTIVVVTTCHQDWTKLADGCGGIVQGSFEVWGHSQIWHRLAQKRLEMGRFQMIPTTVGQVHPHVGSFCWIIIPEIRLGIIH